MNIQLQIKQLEKELNDLKGLHKNAVNRYNGMHGVGCVNDVGYTSLDALDDEIDFYEEEIENRKESIIQCKRALEPNKYKKYSVEIIETISEYKSDCRLIISKPLIYASNPRQAIISIYKLKGWGNRDINKLVPVKDYEDVIKEIKRSHNFIEVATVMLAEGNRKSISKYMYKW